MKPRYIFLDAPDFTVIHQLLGLQPETQVEELLMGFLNCFSRSPVLWSLNSLSFKALAPYFTQSPLPAATDSLVTNLVCSGSLCWARRMASLATSSWRAWRSGGSVWNQARLTMNGSGPVA